MLKRSADRQLRDELDAIHHLSRTADQDRGCTEIADLVGIELEIVHRAGAAGRAAGKAVGCRHCLIGCQHQDVDATDLHLARGSAEVDGVAYRPGTAYAVEGTHVFRAFAVDLAGNAATDVRVMILAPRQFEGVMASEPTVTRAVLHALGDLAEAEVAVALRRRLPWPAKFGVTGEDAVEIALRTS